MAQVGNFSKLRQAREQAFYADAALNLARAEQAATSSRERLARVLGLADRSVFQLPERLPDLPTTVNELPVLEQAALDQRLDLQAIRIETEALASNLGLSKATRLINVLEVGPARVLEGARDSGYKKGYEISFELPIFDWGGAKVAKADWFDVVTPFAFGMPTFDIVMILTMALVMIVVMIESTGMFLALSDLTGKKIDQPALAAGLRTDGLGTLIGGLFNTFPYTSFSQNVGLVGVTGVKSRWVCVAGGIIMIVLGMLPKMAAFVEAIPQFVLGGAGLVMFGMVAATGIRILANVDFKGNRHNLYIVALSIGFGLIPLVAPRWTQQMAHSLHPLLESGILLTSVAAVALNIFFNGAQEDRAGAIEAAKTAEAH